MDLSGNHMGASVASASDQQRGKQRLRPRRASSAVKLPPNPGSEGAKVAKKARALKRHGTRSDGAAEDVANDVADDGAKVVGKARLQFCMRGIEKSQPWRKQSCNSDRE